MIHLTKRAITKSPLKTYVSSICALTAAVMTIRLNHLSFLKTHESRGRISGETELQNVSGFIKERVRAASNSMIPVDAAFDNDSR